MNMQNTILLVEDEAESADLLANFLELHGFNVHLARDGKVALEKLETHAEEIDLAILDRMLPFVSGTEICDAIRKHPVAADIPVIFLTAKDQETDEIEGLAAGADHYMAKPVSLKLIKAHVESLLRRRKPNQQQHWLHMGEVYLDTAAHEVFIQKEPVDVTASEYQILLLFFRNPKVVFSRQEILEHISGDNKFVFDRTVDVHIKNLRLKLGEHGELIKTYRGVGYGLNKELIQ